jgi:2-dehydro-3-deoxyphosphogluconate aldolase / (4S)-4-hydroxy-2-oxoglutarate aldolase
MSAPVDQLRAFPFIAILRGVPAAHVVPLGEALLAGGVRCLEVTFTDADAAAKIEVLRAALPVEVLVGAGTVTTRKRAAAARAAGAGFLVTPHVAPEVNAFAVDHALPVVCGATTPTEIAQALEQGCTFIKLFPAGPLGPDYLRALLGPYPDLEVFAVGGIGLDNAAAYLAAGALGLGIGGALTTLDWRNPDLDAATRLARTFGDLIDAARGGAA